MRKHEQIVYFFMTLLGMCLWTACMAPDATDTEDVDLLQASEDGSMSLAAFAAAATVVNSSAMGLWSPGKGDTCSKAIHDSYSVIAYDGKRYPTWHPPIDPKTGCRFGHEHGRDPKGSKLYAFIQSHFALNGDTAHSGVPFGIANEALDVFTNMDPTKERHEDHMGHKIEWENDVRLNRSNLSTTGSSTSPTPTTVYCSFMTKIHQGTHSKDAFGNNVHELLYFVICEDRATSPAKLDTQLAIAKMTAIGKPGESIRTCDKTTVNKVGSYSPANSPTGNGARFIPDRSCATQYVLVPPGKFSSFSQGLYEDWLTSNYIYSTGGKRLAYFDPHFAVFNPSRYFYSGKTDNMGRSIDLCREKESNGDYAHGGACEGLSSSVTWDDVRSPFNGGSRETYFSQNWTDNSGGKTIWYSDPYGNKATNTSFKGSLKQYIAAVKNLKPYAYESQAFGKSRNYGGSGTQVHAPN